MVLVGVVLVLVALVAGGLLLAGTAQLTDTVDIGILGGTLSLPPLALLVTGMVVITIFWFGWAVLRTGLRRGKRRRAQAAEAAREAEARRVAEQQRLKEEIAAREAELAEERRLRAEASAAAPAPTATTPLPATATPPPPPPATPPGTA